MVINKPLTIAGMAVTTIIVDDEPRTVDIGNYYTDGNVVYLLPWEGVDEDLIAQCLDDTEAIRIKKKKIS